MPEISRFLGIVIKMFFDDHTTRRTSMRNTVVTLH